MQIPPVKSIAFLGVLALALLSPQPADAWPYLETPVSPRSEGMGRAWSLFETGAFATWANPGMLAFSQGVEVAGSRFEPGHPFPEDPSQTWAAGAAAFRSGRTSWGVGASYRRWEENVCPACASPEAHIGRQDELGVHLGLARVDVLGLDRLGIGVAVRDDVAARNGFNDPQSFREGMTFDLGLSLARELLDEPGRSFTLLAGATATNLGRHYERIPPGIAAAPFSIEETISPPPHRLRLGIGGRFAAGDAGLSIPAPAFELSAAGAVQRDFPVAFPEVQTEFWARHGLSLEGGLEARFLGLLALRGGYLFDRPEFVSGPTWGLGVSPFGVVSFDISKTPQESNGVPDTKLALSARWPY